MNNDQYLPDLPKSTLTSEDVRAVQEICKILSRVLIRLDADNKAETEGKNEQ